MRDHLSMAAVTGPPGAGKSTALLAIDRAYPQVARFGVRDYGLHLAALGDPLGLAVRDPLLRQELLSNDLVRTEFVHFLDHLPAGVRTVAVEGYPRDTRQCEDLLATAHDRGAEVAAFVVVDIPDDVVRMRVARRRLCGACGRETDVAVTRCQDCGGAVVKRRDDAVARLESRLADYREASRQLRAFFGERGLLRVVDGLLPSDEVRAALADLLGLGKPDHVPLTTERSGR